ncbi:hypothetical protein [Pseudomonas sp.]|uniref:hypothetical protein n=1 Tax=Pseudomonas sp. TaxID=306 RepID=UPI00262F81F8|nr:hypothetical protein [Pseudomonas sp.]
MGRRILCFFLCLSFSFNSFAAAPGAALGNEIAAIVAYKAGIRGFAANDPRFGAALAALGTAATEIGIGVVAVGTAPAWGTVLASAAVAGAVGYAFSALSNWLFNSDGTVTITSAGYTAGSAMTAGGSYWYCSGVGVGQYLAGDPMSACQGAVAAQNILYAAYGLQSLGAVEQSTSTSITYWLVNAAGANVSNIGATYTASGAPHSCPGGQAFSVNNGTCGAVPPPAGSPPQTVPIATALAELTASQLATPLANADVASLADALWRRAASDPGYAGLPYISTDPVTANDVAATIAANPGLAPATVGDLAASIPAANAVTPVPGSAAAAAAANPGVNPAASSPLVNLGSDPGIGAPSLESTPTASMILSPIFSLFPTLRNFVVPSHNSVCPTPSMTIFGKYILMDGQCTLLEAVRPTLYAVMAFVWLVVALFIVLAA